jgi:hypothetical protein
MSDEGRMEEDFRPTSSKPTAIALAERFLLPKKSSVASPILLHLSLHRWRVRVFDLMRRAGPESQNEQRCATD